MFYAQVRGGNATNPSKHLRSGIFNPVPVPCGLDGAMRLKIISLLFAALVLTNLSLAVVFACVWRNSVFHASDVRFFRTAWANFLSLEGSSGNGFISGIIAAAISILAVLLIVGHLHGVAKMKEHLLQDSAIGLFVLLVGTILVYGPQFAWEVAHTAYMDHKILAKHNSELVTENAHWRGQATNVASIVCNPPREPKLELLIDAKPANGRTVEIQTPKPSVVPLQMVVKNVGMAEANDVSMRLYLKAGFEPPTYTADTSWQQIPSDEPDYPDEYYSSSNYPSVSRSIEAGEPLGWAPFLIQPQPGISIGSSGIPVKVKLFYGAPKPLVVDFRVKVLANGEN